MLLTFISKVCLFLGTKLYNTSQKANQNVDLEQNYFYHWTEIYLSINAINCVRSVCLLRDKMKVLGLHLFSVTAMIIYHIWYIILRTRDLIILDEQAMRGKIRNKTPDFLFPVTSPILMSNDEEKNQLYSYMLHVNSFLYPSTLWRAHHLVNKKKEKERKEKWSNLSHQNCWQYNLCQVYGIDYFKFVNRHDWFILTVILNWIHIQHVRIYF